MLREQGMAPCIPPRRNGNKQESRYTKRVYNMGHKVACWASLKDWHRIATRYNCCASIFRSAALLGAAVIFWL